jgi:uncharacterized protein (DUF2252 family)
MAKGVMKICGWITVALLGISVLGARRVQAEGPLEVLQRTYGPYLAKDDQLAMPMKVRALVADEYGLWRGGKDLFFNWCRTHCREWIADTDATMTLHGDQHLGNIGTYLVDQRSGELAFGMVDFDDSHRMPFMFELLQGVVTVRLTAREAKIPLSNEEVRALVGRMLEDYRAAARSDRTATDLLRNDSLVAKLLTGPPKRDFAQELKRYVTRDGKLVERVVTKRGMVKEILRPAGQLAEPMARGIAQALVNSPEMAKRFTYADEQSIRAGILDVAQRTRIGSAGSQGLTKYFVLMFRPLVGVESNVVLYVKQEIPSPAERTGIIPKDARDPGQRCAEDMDELCRPRPVFNSWCRIGDQSYWVTIREPWTNELDPEDIKNVKELEAAARIWAVASGATHQHPRQSAAIDRRVNAKLAGQLVQLSDDYLRQLDSDLKALRADKRVAEMVRTAERKIAETRLGPGQ